MAKKDANKRKADKKALEPLFKSAKRDFKKFTQFTEAMENPNRTLQKTKEGMRLGLELFREMESDSQIGSDLQARKLKVRSFAWNVICENGNESDIKYAKEIENIIRPIYRTLVKEIQDALVLGFSICELNWEQIEGKIVLPSVLGHDQKKFTFTKEWGLFFLTDENETKPVWEYRVLCATFDMRKGNRYGRSLLTDAFWPWFFKKHGWLFWSNYLEKFGQPTVVGKYPSSVNDKETKDALLSCCQAIQNDMAVTIPQEWVIELLEAKRGGAADTYESFVKYCDRCLSKVILLSVLTSNEAQFGTKAHADVHKDLTDQAVEDDALWIADEISNQVVFPLVQWNTNSTAQYRFKIQYETEDTGKESAERDQILTNILPVRINDLKGKYNWQDPGDDDIVVFRGELYRWGSIKEKIMSGESIHPQAADQPGPTSDFAEFSARDIDDIDRVVMADNDTIDAWGDLWEDLLEDTIDLKGLQNILEKAGDWKKAILALEKYKSTRSADFWQKCLTAAALLGERSVQKQIEAAGGSSEFAELDIDNKFHFGHPDEAIRYFKRKLPIPKAVWNSIDGEMKQYAFYVSQLEDTGLINFVKEKMIEALEKGKTFRMFAKELFEVSGTKQFFGHMKTAFNTNMFNALNYQNGVALLRNVKRFPNWRFSAVMDGKTRESHAGMHGYVARYDDPIWSSWYPPCGFNCRCRITIASQKQFENIDDDFRRRANALQPDQGFETSPVENLKGNVIRLLKEFKEKSLNLNATIRRAA